MSQNDLILLDRAWGSLYGDDFHLNPSDYILDDEDEALVMEGPVDPQNQLLGHLARGQFKEAEAMVRAGVALTAAYGADQCPLGAVLTPATEGGYVR